MRLKILAFSLFLLYVALCAFVLFFMGVTKTTFVVLGVVGGFLGILIFLVLKKDLQPALARFIQKRSMNQFENFGKWVKSIESDPKKLAKLNAELMRNHIKEIVESYGTKQEKKLVGEMLKKVKDHQLQEVLKSVKKQYGMDESEKEMLSR